jgi:two-component system response regulator YesN
MVRRHTCVRRIVAAIDEHYREPTLQLADVARHVNLSPCYLCRLLKEVTGRGFVAHLHARRVVAARELLEQPALSVKEIAMSVGYKSLTQLGRHYKETYGVTPSSTRDRFMQGPADHLHTNRERSDRSQELMPNRKIG